MKYRLLIQYDGTDHHGWQIQDNARSIQGELERVLSFLDDAPVKVAGSGRTDAGVHAEGQVASLELRRTWEFWKLRNAINGNLPRDIRVMEVTAASDDFHARFSAKGKTYIYRIVNAAVMPPFWRRYALHETRELDIERMRRAAGLLVGEHDWTAFSSALSESESKVRDVRSASIEVVSGELGSAELIEFRISAKGFLRYMVRSITGTLLEIGRGEKEPEVITTAIETGDRSLAGQTAPPHGLTLFHVEY